MNRRSAIAAVMLVTLAFILALIRWHQDLDFGDVPTWMAFAGAGIATVFAARLFDIENQRDKRLEELRRSEQAAHIGVWPEVRTMEVTPSVFRDRLGFAIRNASNLPVYDAAVFSYTTLDGYKPEYWFPIGVVAPTGERSAWVVLPNQAGSLDGESPHLWSFAIQFTDTAGIQWSRDADGKLRESPLSAPSDAFEPVAVEL